MSAAEAFLAQARACEGLGSSFTARLLRMLARELGADLPVLRRITDWPGPDMTATGDAVALRLAGGLHALHLTGADAELSGVYPPHTPDDDALRRVVLDTIGRHATALHAALDRPPQTNEVRRAVVPIAAGALLTRRYGLPLRLSELGASAGLNLNWDRFALTHPGGRAGPPDAALTLTPEWTGPALPDATPVIADRRGVDLAPFDLETPSERLRLTSYIWPDQPHRLDLTTRAIDLARAQGAAVDAGDVLPWLAARLSTRQPGTVELIYHTIAWQYFPDATARAARAAIEAAGQAATADAPLAWLGMEPDGDTPGAAITLKLWPGGALLPLGRIDFHGRWIDWSPRDLP